MIIENCHLNIFRQGRSKWVARFATVRLNSRAPWEQKRRIVGMVESPVEGNSIVVLKLESPITFSDFARPICLPSSDEFIHMGANCVTLAWDAKGASSWNEINFIAKTLFVITFVEVCFRYFDTESLKTPYWNKIFFTLQYDNQKQVKSTSAMFKKWVLISDLNFRPT